VSATPPAHPLTQLTDWFHDRDFAVLDHGFLPHGRDYMVVVESALGKTPGRHRFQFTHCVSVIYMTRVEPDGWRKSWEDTYIDFDAWEQAGTPAGMVWGTNWSLAEVLRSVEPSALAAEWSERLGMPMFEVSLETDRYALSLVFHGLRTQKIDGRTDTISQVIEPLE
jgi:hypothetical protein